MNINFLQGLFNHLESSPRQINFQDPATPIAERIIEIHNHVFFFLLFVLIFVSYSIYKILQDFSMIMPSLHLLYHFH